MTRPVVHHGLDRCACGKLMDDDDGWWLCRVCYALSAPTVVRVPAIIDFPTPTPTAAPGVGCSAHRDRPEFGCLACIGRRG